MTESQNIIVNGNQAVGWGAVMADCHHYFGYPITPQNEIIEWFAKEYPKRGWSFVQGESEWAVAAMLFGASCAGARTMTSTAGPGWGLMQEIISHIVAAELPVVIVDVMRGGPGQGNVQHYQGDYFSTTRGGGQGGHRQIVLAPNSVQENCDLVQLAFYLADKYNTLVLVLTEAIIGQTVEKLEVKKLDFGPVPEKPWAMATKAVKGDRVDHISTGPGMIGLFKDALTKYRDKWEKMQQEEVRYEKYLTDDADLIIVAFGYPSRVSKEAVDQARNEGLKVGLLRPITLWPFPYEPLREMALKGTKFMVVEDNLGQMIEDVRMVAGWDAEIGFVGALDRHFPTGTGMIMPAKVLEAAKKMLGK